MLRQVREGALWYAEGQAHGSVHRWGEIGLKNGVSDGKDASATVRQIRTGIGADDMTVKQLATVDIAERRQRGRRTADDMDREMKLDVIPVIGP